MFAHAIDPDESAPPARRYRLTFGAPGHRHHTWARLSTYAQLARPREAWRKMVGGSMYGVSAYDGQRLVGYARAISDGAFNAYVSSVAVLPTYQRQGIGRELLRRLLAGRDHIQFIVHAAPTVHSFYLRCGFSPALDMLRRDRRH